MNTYKKVLSAVFLLSSSYSAHSLEPAEIDVDGILITPTIEIAGYTDDNYLATEDAESSSIIGIAPSVSIAIPGDKSLVEIDYTLDHQIYNASGAENLTNHYFDVGGNWELDVRNKLALNANVTKTELAANAFTAGELNAFTETSVGAGYTYGAPSATGNIEVGLSTGTNRSDNGENLGRERNFVNYRAALLYKVTDKTRLTAEVNGAKYHYIESDALDSTNSAVLLGAKWEATAKTTGFFKVGKEKKDFKDSARGNTDINSWEMSVNWQPKTYSTVILKTSQKIDEGLYGADYTDNQLNSIQWNHDWGRGYSSKLIYLNQDQDFSTGRHDDSEAYTVGVNYLAKRWLDVGLDYQKSNRNSNQNINDYERNILKLSVNISL